MTDFARVVRRGPSPRPAQQDRQRQPRPPSAPTRRKSRRDDAVAAWHLRPRMMSSIARPRPSTLATACDAASVGSMVERELLRVQQRPEQVAEHLLAVVAVRQRLLHRRHAPPPSAAGDSVARNSSSIDLVVVRVRLAAAAPAGPRGARSSAATSSPFCRCSSCGRVTSPSRSQAQAVTRSERPNRDRKYDFSAGSGS